MKRLIITLAAAVLALSAANAEEKTKTYNFGDITGISAGGIYQIHVTEGKSDKVKVVYDDDIDALISNLLIVEDKDALGCFAHLCKVLITSALDYYLMKKYLV